MGILSIVEQNFKEKIMHVKYKYCREKKMGVKLERYGDKDDPEREKTSNCMVFKTAIFSHNRFEF